MNNLGKKLKAIRLSKELSQEEVAFELGVSLSTYSKIERNVADITISKLEQVGKIFNMSIVEILTYGSAVSEPSVDYQKLLEEKDREIIKLQKELIVSLRKNKGK